ncbi:hypothetical protein AAVH_39552 [Aphelenchoides avenae]|nr:hypothetical protein AAVH_39552 [Aphelenchus avenae]
MQHSVHETTAAWNPKPPPPEQYFEWVLEAWYDGATKDSVINSLKACGIGAICRADNHLIHCPKDASGIRTTSAEAQELAEILAGFEVEAPDEDDTGHVGDAEVTDDEVSVYDVPDRKAKTAT